MENHISYDTCVKYLEIYLQNPDIQAMLGLIKDSGFTSQIACKKKAPSFEARGYFTLPEGEVWLCPHYIHHHSEILDILKHELIHVFDSQVRAFDFFKGHLLACSEVRAAKRVECSSLSDEAHRQSCVRQRAADSTRVSYGSMASDYVDEVFFHCYKDEYPFENPKRRDLQKSPVVVIYPGHPLYSTADPLISTSLVVDSSRELLFSYLDSIKSSPVIDC